MIEACMHSSTVCLSHCKQYTSEQALHCAYATTALQCSDDTVQVISNVSLRIVSDSKSIFGANTCSWSATTERRRTASGTSPYMAGLQLLMIALLSKCCCLVQLWMHAIRYVAEVVLEGISNIKGRCSAIGRNAMSSGLLILITKSACMLAGSYAETARRPEGLTILG